MSTTNVLFEIGLEEMPARFLADAELQLQEKTKQWLTSIRLPYETIKTFVTPRRLAVVITGLASKQLDQEEEMKGPARKIALDKDGNWTKAAIGFTKGQGKSVNDIYFKQINEVEYAFVNKYISGESAKSLLPSFQDVILQLTFPKNMRWADKSLRFIRPIRWILALNESTVIPFEIAGVATDNKTFGHRFLGNQITIEDPLTYQEQLNNQFVIADRQVRKQQIVTQIQALEKMNNWHIPTDSELLEEVTELVEFPTVFHGKFSEEYLAIPDEVLITSMKEHQRYFPVLNNDGTLLPYFVAVRNGDKKHLDTVARGNEKVLKARLSDAMFFYNEDQKHTIEQNNKKLTRMVFQEKLGTIADKVNRVVTITNRIADLLVIDQQVKQQAIRAAEISKFDLVTNMVNEFTKLQGVMGEKYALMLGEKESVAKAINEHYMPRSANDQLPSTIEGAIVSIADKLDTIIGCISVGLIPSGSQDPYALRRQAIGVLQILKQNNWSVSVETLLDTVRDVHRSLELDTASSQAINAEIKSFFYARASFLLKEVTNEQDVIDAVLASGVGNISFAFQKVKLLTEKRHDPDFKSVQEALVRVLNLAKKGENTGVQPALFENQYEQRLYEQYETIKSNYIESLEALQSEESLTLLSELTDPVHAFFEHTMVMSEDEELKRNRLSLLGEIAVLIKQFADLSIIEWKQQVGS